MPSSPSLTSRERRILLTRDVGLLKRKAVVRGHWLRSREPEQQLAEIVDALQLRRAFRPFTRCMTCNGVLAVIARAKVVELVPPRVYRRFRCVQAVPGLCRACIGAARTTCACSAWCSKSDQSELAAPVHATHYFSGFMNVA